MGGCKDVKWMTKHPGFMFYLFDLGTDIFAAVQYFKMGDVVYGSLTAVFTALPYALWIMLDIISDVFKDSGKSVSEKCLAVLKYIVRLPILILTLIFLNVKRDEDPKRESVRNFKLMEAMLESYPQAALQLYIVFQNLSDGEAIGSFQWLTIFASLVSLAYAISSSILFDDAARSSQILFCWFGLLAVASRHIVCCVYSMKLSPLWLMPFVIELFASVFTWITIAVIRVSRKNTSDLEMSSPTSSSSATPSPGIISPCEAVIEILIFVLADAYNCFTLSGMLVSTINVIFAIGAYFFMVDVPQLLTMIALSLATISFVTSVAITALPCYRRVSRDWRLISRYFITTPLLSY